MIKIRYVIVMVFAMLLSVSCSSDDDNGSDANDAALVGSWMATESDEDGEYKITVTFNANQTGTLFTEVTFAGESESESESFTWSTNENKLTIDSSSEPPEVLTYSISGNKLLITDSDNFTTSLTKI